MTHENTKDLSQDIAPELFKDEPQLIEDDTLDLIAPRDTSLQAIKKENATLNLVNKYLGKSHAF